MILPIRLFGDPVLRRSARNVATFDEPLRTLVSDMIETMHDANGVGLAAPQVGVPLRLFVALELGPPVERRDGDDATPASDESDGERAVLATHVMVNPRIVHREGMQVAPDGCLSIPGLWIDDMVRDERVVVQYQDLDGQERECTADGHFAHVIQHELDHLDGVLYFDRLPERQRRTFLEAHRSELADLQRRAKAMVKELQATPVA